MLTEHAAFGGRNGSDTLVDVERIEFADGALALDLDGTAGQVARLLGAVFGRESVQFPSYVGIGLSYLDAGVSYQDLMGAALHEVGARTPAAVVNLLWQNLIGTAPTAQQIEPFVGLIEAGLSAAQFGVLVADTDLNADNIGLVGLMETGLAYG